MFRLGALILFSLLSQLANAQVAYFLSPSGSDQNPGTLQRPFKTLDKALAAACNASGKNVSIQLRGGTYYLDKPITLESSQLKARSLDITAFNGEEVFISAGRELHSKWELYRDGIYKTAVPENLVFERMYMNGKLQILARYPNYDSAARVYHGTAADAIDPGRIKKWKKPVGGYVHALHAHEWGSFDYRITGIDDSGHLQLAGGWQNNRPNDMHKQYRFVENIFEELDAPGEWWLDREHHILYYYPASDVDLHSAKLQVSQLKNSIELHGSAKQPVRNVRLRSLHFVHNERSFMDTREPLLRSDWTIYRGGAVLFDGTENCSVIDCSFTGIGGNAIMINNYNKQDTVIGTQVHHIGASAVCLVGDPKAVRSPAFRYEEHVAYSALDKTPGPLSSNYPQYCVITNNLFHDLGEIEKQATGVELDISSSITVSHNSIYNTPRAGLNIGDGCFGGHVLEYNDVFNTVMETGDHGAFNSWGRDRYWDSDRNYMDSLVAVHPELVLLDAQKQTIIRNNRFRCDHGWDIDLDDGSSNYSIYNNLCLNGGLKLREGFFRVVKNNIIVNNSFHPHVWFRNSGDVFEHNIVMKKYFPIQINEWGKRIDYNIFPDSASLGIARANGTDSHSVAGKIRFKNVEAGDYTVIESAVAASVGFKNFQMNLFGVQKPSLKKMAAQPQMPVFLSGDLLADKSATVSFLGGRIKSVDGPGERSAYGLPGEEGVIIVSTGMSTLLSGSGLKDRDVILSADDKPVNTIKDFMDVCQASAWKDKIDITVFRDQRLIKTSLKTK